jgi:uncharacterized protein YjiS (DUF1127 family)
MTDISYSRHSVHIESATLTAIVTVAKTAIEVVRRWRQNYRSRRELAMYSHHERSDLNFACDVDAELAKPFWKA